MSVFEKNFDFVIERAKSLKKPARVVVTGAYVENILSAVFQAEAEGFCRPVLVGSEDRILAVLDRMGLKDRSYDICHVDEGDDLVQHAIDVVNAGMGDILMRGNTSTRSFLMPILNKQNKLVKGFVSEVALVKVPYYDRILALSDVSVSVNPSVEQRMEIVKNTVEVLNALGNSWPNVALLALAEKPSFHMRDTVEAQNIVREHEIEPLANCNIVGPITWDLIVSKDAAKAKGYECDLCGEFDAVVMPSVMAGNTTMKVLGMSADCNTCGVLAGTTVPVAMTSRASSVERVYLSLCVAAAMLKK